MIAALREGRNCLSIENDPLLFIHGKINVINVLKKKRDTEVDTLEAQEET